MRDQIKHFHSTEFGDLDVIMIDDKPYFPASECAKTLGYANPRKAIIDHCRGVTKRDGVSRTTNQHGVTTKQTVSTNYIPEGDLYRLIIRSKLPAAERFERWVFDEVLPSIRKHGAYIFDAVLEEAARNQAYADDLFRRLQEEKEKTSELRDQAEKNGAKAAYCDMVLMSGGSLPVSVIAKDYGMTAAEFNRLLHLLGVQYKLGMTWLLYSRYAGKGYTRSRTYYVPGGTCAIHTRWTQKGRLFLYDTLKSCGLLPVSERAAV